MIADSFFYQLFYQPMTICIYLYSNLYIVFIHLFIHLLPIFIHLGNIYIHVFCDLWHGNFQNELVCPERRNISDQIH